MEIEIPKKDDLDTYLRLNKEFYDEQVELERSYTFPSDDLKYQFNEMINNSNYSLLFIKSENKKAVGFILGMLDKKNPYVSISTATLQNIFISKVYRNKGYGKELLHKFFEWCITKGVEKIRADVLYANKKAINFYEKVDFVIYEYKYEFDLKNNLNLKK